MFCWIIAYIPILVSDITAFLHAIDRKTMHCACTWQNQGCSTSVGSRDTSQGRWEWPVAVIWLPAFVACLVLYQSSIWLGEREGSLNQTQSSLSPCHIFDPVRLVNDLVAFNHFQQHTSHMNMMLITAIKLTEKCTKHAVTIWQDIMSNTHQEAFKMSKCRWGSRYRNKWSGHCDSWWEYKVRGCYCLQVYGKSSYITQFFFNLIQSTNIQLCNDPLLPVSW